jgi:hemerythrin-like domain-containing protein
MTIGPDEMPIRIGQRPDHGFDEPIGLLSDCHRRIEHFLDVAIVIEQRARGGALTPSQRTDLEATVRYFATAAPRHTADEEESLFPRLRACADPAVANALDAVAHLETDHRDAEAHHRAVDGLLRRWLDAGSLASAEADQLRDHLAALGRLYREHIAIEDRHVFPVAQRLLSPSDIADIGREMRARRSTTVPSERSGS